MPLTGSGMVRHMTSMIYGYARVSTNDQTTNLQRDALERAGRDRILTDVASGARAHRPKLDHMLDLLREGDTVVVWKLDRLGRSMQNLVDLMVTFDERGARFRSLTESIDTSTPGGTLVFNIFGWGRCRFVGLVIDSITTNHATRPSPRRRSMMPVSELRLDPPVPVPDHVVVEHVDEPVHRNAREAPLVEELDWLQCIRQSDEGRMT